MVVNCREKQLESDAKTIERAHRDLIKLEGELEVSMEEFVKVQKLSLGDLVANNELPEEDNF